MIIDPDENVNTLLRKIADDEDKLAVQLARRFGDKASDVINASRQISARCRVSLRSSNQDAGPAEVLANHG